jgi:hypothetical protein
MKDIRNKEVNVGDTVVFNHPSCRTLDSGEVLAIVQYGIIVDYHMSDDSVARALIPERQFAIIGGN